MRTLAERLLEVTSATPDRTVALMIAEYMLAMTDVPFRFSINHDIRPPKCASCPVDYTWTKKDACGIEWKHSIATKKWLTDALLCGYTVSQMDRHRKPAGRSSSLAIVRRRAEYHQAPKVPNDSDGDDIPF